MLRIFFGCFNNIVFTLKYGLKGETKNSNFVIPTFKVQR